MGRKRSLKHYSPSSLNTTDNIYRKRLRSWNQRLSQLKSNPSSSISSFINNRIIPHHKSTIFTYPINLNNDRQSILSNPILSESLTTESAFFSSSIPYNSNRTSTPLNNNHITTLNTDIRKRKTNTISSESIPTQMKEFEILSNPNDQLSIDNLQLNYRTNLAKRSRMSTGDSIITNHSIMNYPLSLIDQCTIDINQLDKQEPISSSIDDPIESLPNNSHSMEAAVKMIQPIIDIIFNAFEDQIKNIQTKPIQSSCSNSSLVTQYHHPVIIPYVPSVSPVHPIILHAVNIDIQLTKKNSINKLNLTNISSILSIDYEKKTNNYLKRKHKLKRIVQLAIFGASVLCGYLFL